MITLGYEDPVMMPTMLVYNTDLMKAYIAGVKEQYDNARADMKDFMKQYGDFYSPIAGDNEAYYNMTLGGANKMIADMMALGIDPYKSPEARNAIAKYIASVPTGKINEMRQSAENAKEYLSMKAKLQAAGKWNQAYEDYLLGGKSLENWDTVRDGMWTRTSPSEYRDIFDITNPWFNDLKPSFIEQKGGYDYIGITEDLMKPIVDQRLSDYLGSDIGRFHYEQFKKSLPSNINDNIALEKFKNEILSKNSEVKHVTRTPNEYDMLARQYSYANKYSYANSGSGAGYLDSYYNYASDRMSKAVTTMFGDNQTLFMTNNEQYRENFDQYAKNFAKRITVNGKTRTKINSNFYSDVATLTYEQMNGLSVNENRTYNISKALASKMYTRDELIAINHGKSPKQTTLFKKRADDLSTVTAKSGYSHTPMDKLVTVPTPSGRLLLFDVVHVKNNSFNDKGNLTNSENYNYMYVYSGIASTNGNSKGITVDEGRSSAARYRATIVSNAIGNTKTQSDPHGTPGYIK